MNRRSVLASGALLAAGGLSGCLAAFNSPGDGEDDDYDVGMTDSAFDPATVEVAVGDTVVWKNTSGRSHTVTAYDDQIPDGATYFASGDFADEETARNAWTNGGGAVVSGDTYQHTFETPGEHHYVCIPHERVGMTGTVVVK